MKKLITILLLFICFNSYAQRILPTAVGKRSNYNQLAQQANAAFIAASTAHSTAAAAHNAKASALGKAVGANEHTTAAANHNAASAAANKAALSFAPPNTASIAATSYTATVASLNNITHTEAAADSAASDSIVVAADAAAAIADAAATQASAAALAAADDSNNDNHIIEIQGLGNIANSQNGNSLSPSASINAKIVFLPNNKNAKLYLGYNLGAELDSTKIDSIKLGNLFLPERSKSGYIARLEYNIAALFGNPAKSSKDGRYNYSTELNPFVEYNYNKVNIKDVKEDSSKIQTNTWIFGINFNHSIYTKDNDNTIGIQVTPYYKSVSVTEGTFDVYNAIFKPTLKGTDAPSKVSFFGITFGLQINRFLFSFDYQSLKTKSLESTPLNGGVFTLRATVVGDLIKL